MGISNTCRECGVDFEGEKKEDLCFECQIKLKKEGRLPNPQAVKSELPAQKEILGEQTFQEEPAADEPNPATLTKGKILIIDDTPEVRFLLKNRFQKKDYSVIVAQDGMEGLMAIETQNPDLVVSDVLMPRMTGFDLVKKIRKRADAIRKTPILIFTGRPGMKDFFSPWEIDGFYSVDDVGALVDKAEEVIHYQRTKISQETE